MEITNEQIMHLLAQTYAMANMNQQLIRHLLVQQGDQKVLENLPKILESIHKDAYQIRQLYGLVEYQGPKLPDWGIDDFPN